MKIDKSLPKVVLLIISLEEKYDHLLEQLSQSTKSGYAERLDEGGKWKSGKTQVSLIPLKLTLSRETEREAPWKQNCDNASPDANCQHFRKGHLFKNRFYVGPISGKRETMGERSPSLSLTKYNPWQGKIRNNDNKGERLVVVGVKSTPGKSQK